MPQFHITSPDGHTYDVTAPDGANEQDALEMVLRQERSDFQQQAQALSPVDLQVARSKNDRFGAYLRDMALAPKDGETEQQRQQRLYGSLSSPSTGVGEGMARSYLQGGTFNLGDEAVATAAAALDPLVNGERGKSFGERYGAYVGAERAKMKQFSQQHPALDIGSQVAGGVSLAPLLPGGPQATTLGGRVLSGGATAGGYGAAYGFGAGQDTLSNRLMNAGRTAAIAAPVGMAAPLVAAGVRNAADYLQTGAAAREAGMPRPAYDTLTRAMDADQSLSGQGAQNIQRAGPQGMLADAGPNARQILDTAVQTSGPANTIARQAVDARVGDASRQVSDALDTTFGQPLGVTRMTTAVRNITQPARNAAYEAAYAQPVDYSTEVGRRIENLITDRVPRGAIANANALMRAEGLRSQQIIARVADDGSIVYQRMPDVRQIDYITRSLADIARRAEGQGAMGGTTNAGRIYGNLGREIRSLTRESVPQYATALDTAARPIEARNALEIGRRALSVAMPRDQFAEDITGMSAAERSYVGQGIRSQIDDAVANVQRAFTDPNMDAREAAKAIRMLSSRASREKVATLLGDQQAMQLFDTVDQATSAFELKAAIAMNSKTYPRMVMNEAIQAQTEGGALNALRSGEPVNAGRRLAQIVGRRTPADKQRIADETYSALVNALTGPRGQNAVNLLQQMQAQQGQIPLASQGYGRLAEELMRRSGAVTGPLATRR